MRTFPQAGQVATSESRVSRESFVVTEWPIPVRRLPVAPQVVHAPIASVGQCSLSGGTPSKASIRSSTVNSRHCSIVRPNTSSDNIDAQAIVGPQPTV